MPLTLNRFWSTVLCVTATVGLSAQAPAPSPDASGQPTFRVQIDAVTMDVVVRDKEGRFVSDLAKEDFEIYEDGIKQEIASMTMSHGGRVTNVLLAPPPVAPEGVLLPPRRAVNDSSGRIFLFFVDDLNLQFESTHRVRDLFRRISRELVHEGDLFGIVSSGPSSIAIDMTYDKNRIEQAASRIMGDALKPSEIINSGAGTGGPTQLRHRAYVAMKTMMEGLEKLEQVHDRRKALVWVSEGYDFNPFQEARLGLGGPDALFLQNQSNANLSYQDGARTYDPFVGMIQQGETFSDADLSFELGQIVRQANRANTTIYTIDPRGLVGGPDIEEQVDPQEWAMFVRKSQDTLRVLAEDTGGIAVVNMNNFDQALKRIDAETSDYYVLGYYSSNPDPTQRRRRVEVRALRADTDVTHSRTEYVLKPPPPPVAVSKP